MNQLQATTTPSAAGTLADLFRGRRMALLIGFADPRTLADLAGAGIPCVGLTTDGELASRCREQGLPAWAGDWRRLAPYPERFDAIHLADPQVVTTPMLRTLAAALLPGGRLVITDGTDGATTLPEADGSWDLELQAPVTGALVLHRPAAAEPEPAGTWREVVGPYADALVDSAPVLVPGCGQGLFLAALEVRDLECLGLEPDPELAGRAEGAGLPVERAGAASLRERAGRYGSVYLGNLVEKLDPPARERLIALASLALRPGGRLLVRSANWGHPPVREDLFRRDAANRHPCPPGDLVAMCRRQGLEPAAPAALPRDPANYHLVATRSAGAHPDPALIGNEAIAVDAPTGGMSLNQPLRSPFDLERWERKDLSQGGEDGVLAALFDLVGTTDRFYVEFGCGDGLQCNTARLRRRGWRGVLMDGMAEPAAPDAVIHREWISADNIAALFAKHRVPREFDLLSIDLDGNDYWVWQALDHRPRVVVCEYNANLGPRESLTIPYDPHHRWNGTDYYGASLTALTGLGAAKGYTLVYCNEAGVNAFFLRNDLVPPGHRPAAAAIYRPPNYWYRGGRSPVDLSRTMIRPLP